RQAFMKTITDRGLQISGFSCHNNPISPDPIEAKEADETLRQTIRVESLLAVTVLNTFSGIEGSDNTAKKPNWLVTPWP
ncbi:sugar phosphate isomerase/epimerase, partial [Staphylococcus aureus]